MDSQHASQLTSSNNKNKAPPCPMALAGAVGYDFVIGLDCLLNFLHAGRMVFRCGTNFCHIKGN